MGQRGLEEGAVVLKGGVFPGGLKIEVLGVGEAAGDHVDVAHGIERVGLVGAQDCVAPQGAHGGIHIAGLPGGVSHGVEYRHVLRLQVRRLPIGLLRLPVLVAVHQRIGQRAPGVGIAAIQLDELGEGAPLCVGIAGQFGGLQFQADPVQFGDGIAARQRLVERGGGAGAVLALRLDLRQHPVRRAEIRVGCDGHAQGYLDDRDVAALERPHVGFHGSRISRSVRDTLAGDLAGQRGARPQHVAGWSRHADHLGGLEGARVFDGEPDFEFAVAHRVVAIGEKGGAGGQSLAAFRGDAGRRNGAHP